VDLAGAAIAARSGDAGHGDPRADQVIRNDDGTSRNVTGEDLAGHLPHATLFVHEALADRAAEHRFKPLAELLRPLHATKVGRHNRHLLIADECREVPGEQEVGIEVIGVAAEGILEGGEAVRLQVIRWSVLTASNSCAT
jgi:hypothetical protein